MSDFVQTPNLGLYKPNYQADYGQWGYHLNTNADIIDAQFGGGVGALFLPLAGGTVSPGPLVISATTTGNFETAFLAHGSLYGAPNQANANWAQIALDVDYADAAAGGGPGTVNYLYVGGNIEAGFSGHRTGVNAHMYVAGTPGAHSVTQFITGLVGWSGTGVADNGQNNNIMGGNLAAKLNTGATGWGGLVGLEVDITAQSGTSVNLKEGIKIVIGSDDLVQGSSVDVAMTVVMPADGAGPGTGGFQNGLSFGNATGVWPMLATSTLIGTLPTSLVGRAYSAANGVDFGAVTFSGHAFRSPGFSVDGAGNVLPHLLNAANDAAAASAGVPLNALYRNGNAVQIRLT